ncbi:MAG TPA: leucine-rich repeat domain-containing protein, partial [Chlamydiales bacterium]|nr:leucine-rich repeat domain-containing protein [Chlamydiales bacterium]
MTIDFQWRELPLDVQRQIVDGLDPQTSAQFEQASWECLKRVHSSNIRSCLGDPVVEAAYDSNKRVCRRHEAPLDRAFSLVQKTEALAGGAGLLAQARQGPTSLFHPAAQRTLAEASWNSKIIGLYPFLRSMPGGEEFLIGLDPSLSDLERYRAMEKWILDDPFGAAQIQHVEAIHIKREDEPGIPVHFPLPEKILNQIPDAVQYFSGLKSLSLQNNMLTALPECMGTFPIERINLNQNQFQTVPPAIGKMPELKHLHFAANRSPYLGEASPIWKARHLESLDLSNNGMEGILCRKIHRLTQLQTLDLSQNRLDRLPSDMCHLMQLQTLRLEGNQFLRLPGVVLHLLAKHSLRELNFTRNPGLNFSHLAQAIRAAAASGKAHLTIHIDSNQVPNEEVSELFQEINQGGTHTLQFARADEVVRLTL